MKARPGTFAWPLPLPESGAPETIQVRNAVDHAAAHPSLALVSPSAVMPPAIDAEGPTSASPGVRSLERFLRLAREQLAAGSARWKIVALALLLTSTALSLGLTADDHFHALALKAEPGIAGIARSPWDLFAFARDPQSNLALMDEGVFPWWTDPDAIMAFMRPLTSLTIWLDHQLWSDRPVMLHLQNMLWFAALLLVVGAVYRRLFTSAWIAGLSLLLYAIDDARAMTVGWVSNRNALVALTFAFCALWLHHRHRGEGDRMARWLAPACLAIGLLGGETALQVCGYLFAYALFLDRGSRRERALSLAPYVVVVCVWRALYSGLGYGALNSGLYIDPMREPLLFAQELAQRLPVLLLAQFANAFADLWDIYPVVIPAARSVIPLAAVVLLGVLGLIVRPLWLRDPLVRFWAVGCVLATIPVCSCSPTDRVLTATGVGGAALVATLLGSLAERDYPYSRRWVTVTGIALLIIHAGSAPLLLPVRTKGVDFMEKLLAYADQSVPNSPEIADKTLVLVNPPIDPFGGYFPLHRAANGSVRPKHFRWLATGVCDIQIARVDARTLELRPSKGFLSNSSQWLLRNPRRPMRVGEAVTLGDTHFEVIELTADGRPAAVRVHFPEALESASFAWMQWGEHGYVPFTPPAVGKTVLIPAVDMRTALFGEGLPST